MGLDLERVKGLCFDLDGTLSDTDDAWVNQLTTIFNPARFLFRPRDPYRFSRWLVMVSESPMSLIYYWMDSLSLDDNFARLFERLAKSRKHRTMPFLLMNGARELLDSVFPFYPLSVVSVRDEGSTLRFLEQFTIREHFRAVVTSQTCVHTKPYPHPVIFAAEKMNLLPQDCLMIGDTTVDILAGRRAGAQTVGLLCGFGSERELRKAGADLILKDLIELRTLLTPNFQG